MKYNCCIAILTTVAYYLLPVDRDRDIDGTAPDAGGSNPAIASGGVRLPAAADGGEAGVESDMELDLMVESDSDSDDNSAMEASQVNC